MVILKPYEESSMSMNRVLGAAVSCRVPAANHIRKAFPPAQFTTRFLKGKPFMRGVKSLPVQEYGSIDYWNNRYGDECGDSTYDWYQSFYELKHILHDSVPKDSRILMAGCGNAELSEDMVFDGYKDIVNIDISPVVIKLMKQRHHHIPQLTYMTLDARDLSVFGDDSFDAVIDKGLMDSLLCGSEGAVQVMIMLEEFTRVLKPGGVFMLVTYGEPSLRMQHLKDPAFNWDVVLHIVQSEDTKEEVPPRYAGGIHMDENWERDGFLSELNDPDLHFVYVCTKERRKFTAVPKLTITLSPPLESSGKSIDNISN